MPEPDSAAALNDIPGFSDLADPTIREATADDLPALIEIENAVFATDRLSRRSFRGFIGSPRAILRVAEIGGRVAGYHLVLFRQGTAAARLYSLAVAPGSQGRGLGARLLANAEAAAYAADRAVLRLEVEVGNAAALALYRRAGYRQIARLPGYYENGEDGLRLEKPLRTESVPPAPAPFYEQTTEFTCGSACLMMALAAREPGFALTPTAEIGLWRRATTVFLTSGLGGCEPYGLAVTLAEEGLAAEIYVTEPGLLMLQTVRNAEKRNVMQLAQGEPSASAAAHWRCCWSRATACSASACRTGSWRTEPTSGTSSCTTPGSSTRRSNRPPTPPTSPPRSPSSTACGAGAPRGCARRC